MPDLFAGDPAPETTNTTTSADTEASWLDTIKSHVVATSKSFVIDMWLARHTPEKVMPILSTVLERATEEFADSVGSGGGVYAVGYCLGGKYVLTMAAAAAQQGQGLEQQGNERAVEDGMMKSGPMIKCGAVAHGTLVTREDFRGVVAPVSLVCVGECFASCLLYIGIEGVLLTSVTQRTIRCFPRRCLSMVRKNWRRVRSSTRSRSTQEFHMVS